MTTTATRGWLLDTSALAVSAEPVVTAALTALLRASVLYTCPPLEAIALTSITDGANGANGAGYEQLATDRRLAYRSVPLTPGIGARSLELQSMLARRAHLSRVTPGQLVVAATALEHSLSVLHYSDAFELLGQLCGIEQQSVAPLGSLL